MPSAAPGYAGDTLVVLSLRGGFDGLGAIVPAADPATCGSAHASACRPASLLPARRDLRPAPGPRAAAAALALRRTFAAVHAVGQEEPSRSHFTAMAELERAAPGTSLRTGWLDRAVGLRARAGAFQATVVGSTSPNGALAGPVPELTMDSIDGFELSGAWDDVQRAAWNRALQRLNAGAPAPVRQAALGALEAVRHHPGWSRRRRRRRRTGRSTRPAATSGRRCATSPG